MQAEDNPVIIAQSAPSESAPVIPVRVEETSKDGDGPGPGMKVSLSMSSMDGYDSDRHGSVPNSIGTVIIEDKEPHATYENASLVTADDYTLESDHSVQGDSNDDFENLKRDDSFWRVEQGLGSPEIRRVMTPVVISEDGDNNYGGYNGYEFSDQVGYTMQREGGFTMQPPPYSNSMIHRWE
jgi:hypothetical protein